MKLFTLISLSWLFLYAAAHSSLSEQLSLESQKWPDNIISITNSDLSLVSKPNRDHYTILLLTSSAEEHKCASCITIRRVLSRVASFWYAEYFMSNYLFIAEVDLVDKSNAKVFNYLGLQTVPQLWLVPPSSISSKHSSMREPKYDKYGEEYFDNFDILLEPHAEFKLEAGSFNDQVFKMTDWLGKALQRRITIPQENPSIKFALAFIGTFSIILTIKKRGPSFITRTVTKKKVYQVAFFAYLLILLGGFSFSFMKQVPFIAKNEKGQPIYISGGIHYQFGDEIFLVGGIYGLLAATIVGMIWLGNYKVSASGLIASEELKSILMLIFTGLLYLFYSIMTSMASRKDPGYPYHLSKIF